MLHLRGGLIARHGEKGKAKLSVSRDPEGSTSNRRVGPSLALRAGRIEIASNQTFSISAP
jgi:hypothetical protein